MYYIKKTKPTEIILNLSALERLVDEHKIVLDDGNEALLLASYLGQTEDTSIPLAYLKNKNQRSYN